MQNNGSKIGNFWQIKADKTKKSIFAFYLELN